MKLTPLDLTMPHFVRDICVITNVVKEIEDVIFLYFCDYLYLHHVHPPRCLQYPNLLSTHISSVFTETSDKESLKLLLNGITVVSGPSTIDNSLLPVVKNHR